MRIIKGKMIFENHLARKLPSMCRWQALENVLKLIKTP